MKNIFFKLIKFVIFIVISLIIVKHSNIIFTKTTLTLLISFAAILPEFTKLFKIYVQPPITIYRHKIKYPETPLEIFNNGGAGTTADWKPKPSKKINIAFTKKELENIFGKEAASAIMKNEGIKPENKFKIRLYIVIKWIILNTAAAIFTLFVTGLFIYFFGYPFSANPAPLP